MARTVKAAAVALGEKLAPFAPSRVVYIERGGRPLGLALAELYRIPAHGIDIGYPVSRLPHPLLRALAFPFKELCYRLTRPRLMQAPPFPPTVDLRQEYILLVDDSASSGKTIAVATDALRCFGVRGTNIRVAVQRQGRRAAAAVDAAFSPR